MKKFIKPAIIIILVLGALGAGAYYYLSPDTVEVVVADKGVVSPILSGVCKIEGDS